MWGRSIITHKCRACSLVRKSRVLDKDEKRERGVKEREREGERKGMGGEERGRKSWSREKARNCHSVELQFLADACCVTPGTMSKGGLMMHTRLNAPFPFSFSTKVRGACGTSAWKWFRRRCNVVRR